MFDIVLERVARGRPERSLVLTGLRGVGKTVLLNTLRSQAIGKLWGTGKIEARPDQSLRRPLAAALHMSIRELPRRAEGAGSPGGEAAAAEPGRLRARGPPPCTGGPASSHGGQRAPLTLGVKLQQPIVSGFGHVDGVPVYVTNGAGFWGPPVRVGAPPQVTLIELRSPA